MLSTSLVQISLTKLHVLVSLTDELCFTGSGCELLIFVDVTTVHLEYLLRPFRIDVLNTSDCICFVAFGSNQIDLC